MKAVIGVQEPKPIAGVPDGKFRLVLRNNDFAQLFVKTESGIRQFILEDCGELWHAHETARKERRVLRCIWLGEQNFAKCVRQNPAFIS